MVKPPINEKMEYKRYAKDEPVQPVKACPVCKGELWLVVDGGEVACPLCVPRPPPMRRSRVFPWRKVPMEQHEDAKPNKVFNRIKEQTLWRKSPKKFLVEMTFSNGNVGFMVVNPIDRIWQYKGESYVVVESAAKWCGTARKAMLRYVEGYCLPVELNPEALVLRDRAAAKAPDIKASFEPSVLREVLRFEYVKAMLRSQGAIIFIIILVACFANLLLGGIHLYMDGKFGKWW